MHASCVDRDSTGKQNVKVYFGPFHIEDLFDRLGCFLSKDEALSYKTLDKKNILPKIFYFCVKYCAEMRTIRTDMCYKTKVIVPYLKALDRKEQIIRALKDMYKIFPEISLQYIGMQLAPVEKLQFYFLLGEIR